MYTEEQVKEIVKFAVDYHYRRDMIQLACSSVRSSTEESMFNDLNDYYYEKQSELKVGEKLFAYITEDL